MILARGFIAPLLILAVVVGFALLAAGVYFSNYSAAPVNIGATQTAATSSPTMTSGPIVSTSPANRQTGTVSSTPKSSSLYEVKGGVVYAHGGDTPSLVVSGADAASFVVLSGGAYAKDKNTVYCDGTVLPHADSKSFSVLLAVNTAGAYGMWDVRYAKDDIAVFADCEAIADADSGSFTPLYYAGGTFSGYATDKNAVYGGSTVFKADRGSFRLINDPQGDYTTYAADKSTVYGWRGPLAGADPSTFKALGWSNCSGDGVTYGGPFAVDAAHVYDGDELIQGADPKTFVLQASSTTQIAAKDKQHSYSCDGTFVQ